MAVSWTWTAMRILRGCWRSHQRQHKCSRALGPSDTQRDWTKSSSGEAVRFMDQVSTAATLGLGERIVHRLLTRSPLGLLVRWVAGIQASVHAKLLGGYLLVTLLFIAMGVLSLQTIARMSRQSQLLQQAHERVDASRQIEHALAMQMNF